MDDAFLNGEAVTCKAMLLKSDLEKLKKGDKIVIQLSNRVKYMGLVTDVALAATSTIAMGHFEVKKY